jgi:hypothetical protein
MLSVRGRPGTRGDRLGEVERPQPPAATVPAVREVLLSQLDDGEPGEETRLAYRYLRPVSGVGRSSACCVLLCPRSAQNVLRRPVT